MALRRDHGQAVGLRTSLIVSLSIVLALVTGCYRSHGMGTDSEPVTDGGIRRDGATTDAGPVSCDEESLPAPSGPPCTEAVNACRSACPAGDEPCRDACFDAPCRACFYGTIFHCANEAGCEPLWRDFACCVESVPTCSALRGFDRVYCASSCPMRFEPYTRCIEETGGMDCFLRAAIDCNVR